MIIGERIRQRRIELNMTQDELAQKIGYKSRSSVIKLESARVLPSRKIENMANALECTPSFLMGWTDSPSAIPVLEKHTPDHIPSLADYPNEYSPEEIEKAMMLYEKYKDSIPEIQQAVESLLKSHQSDS